MRCSPFKNNPNVKCEYIFWYLYGHVMHINYILCRENYPSINKINKRRMNLIGQPQ